MSLDEESRERAARRIAASLEEPERHLDFESELAPYVDGTLDAAGREIVDSHIEDCAMCRAELEDLQRVARAPRGGSAFRFALPFAAAVVLAVTALLMLRSDDAKKPVNGVQQQVRVPVPERPTGAPPPAPRKEETPSPPPKRYAKAEWAAIVAKALESGRLPVSPALAALQASRIDSLRGATGTAHAKLSPAGVVVESVRPLFQWTTDAPGEYVVSVWADDEEVAASPKLTTTRWRPERDLARGRTYTWQVEVIRNGASLVLPEPPAAPALFRILGKKEHEELEAARRAHPDDPLLLAALYARHGLVAEADEELRKLSTSTDARVQRLLRARGSGAGLRIEN
ncbi:MAG TPA: hypothetical protein VHK90_13750 [Thermoanaerobaculia bacterium]|nr:hypothetical protein [Thermoanaerobaculia bacterium]